MKELAELNAIYQKMSTPDVDEAMIVTNADKKGNTKAYQNYKAGMKNPKTGKPVYKAADHMKESKKAKKDYDGDGKIESGKEEYFGSKDKAIKKAMNKEEVEIKEKKMVKVKLTGGGVEARDEIRKRMAAQRDPKAPPSEYAKKHGSGMGEETEYNYVSQYLENAPRMQKGAMAYDGPNKAASEAKDRVMAKAKAKRKGPKPTVTIDKPDSLVSMKVSKGYKENFDALVESGKFSDLELQRIIFDDFEENYHAMRNPEKDPQNKPYKEKSRAERMADPERGINSPAFKKFMADRGM